MPRINPLDYPASACCTILEACALAGVSRRTIYNWIDRDRIEYGRTISGSIRIVKASLFQPVEEQDDHGSLVD